MTIECDHYIGTLDSDGKTTAAERGRVEPGTDCAHDGYAICDGCKVTFTGFCPICAKGV